MTTTNLSGRTGSRTLEEEHHVMDVILPALFDKVLGEEEEKEAEAEDTCDALLRTLLKTVAKPH